MLLEDTGRELLSVSQNLCCSELICLTDDVINEILYSLC